MRTKVGASKPYGQSELGNILSSNQPARPCGRESIISISLHPGSIATDLTRTATLFVRTFVSLVIYPAPAAGELNGKSLTACARVTLPQQRALNPKLGRRLCHWREEQVNDV